MKSRYQLIYYTLPLNKTNQNNMESNELVKKRETLQQQIDDNQKMADNCYKLIRADEEYYAQIGREMPKSISERIQKNKTKALEFQFKVRKLAEEMLKLSEN